MTAYPAIASTVDDLRRRVSIWRSDGKTVALVPTMGALHAGHLKLIEEARNRAQKVIVSIFVNPTQFAPTEDFDSYPRTFDDDVAKMLPYGVDAVFAPNAAEMYRPDFATGITVKGPALGLETDYRPHFFSGVAVVVAKLLLSALPDIALFGEKDYQQLLVVRQMVRDLNIPTEILAIETVREDDGLAMSSRNAYLSSADRVTAARLNVELRAVADTIRAGGSAETALKAARAAISEAGFRLDYLELRHAETLQAIDLDADKDLPMRLLVAAWLGKTRLIDNIGV
ncbi:MAG: pantoate--beta-alanine ligase [Hyphomicrobiales bacterium]|nr:MAG: pantoate--beta-alanine ligase [Hyphomicrobiales bacterium]